MFHFYLVLGYFLLVNLVCYCCYAYDKYAAIKSRWRISESHLHILALLGAWPAAIVAQQQLRHKTQKRSFRCRFYITVMINIIVCIVLAYGAYKIPSF